MPGEPRFARGTAENPDRRLAWLPVDSQKWRSAHRLPKRSNHGKDRSYRRSLFVFDEARKLLDHAVSEPFRLTQREAADRRKVTLSTDGLNVSLELETYSPSCLQLDIDGGDGTEPTQKRLAIIPNGCLIENRVFRFDHAFAAPGTYEVILHASEFDPEIPLEDVVGPFELQRDRRRSLTRGIRGGRPRETLSG